MGMGGRLKVIPRILFYLFYSVLFYSTDGGDSWPEKRERRNGRSQKERRSVITAITHGAPEANEQKRKPADLL